LLWLWCRPAATIRSPSLGTSICLMSGQKERKKERKKEKERKKRKRSNWIMDIFFLTVQTFCGALSSLSTIRDRDRSQSWKIAETVILRVSRLGKLQTRAARRGPGGSHRSPPTSPYCPSQLFQPPWHGGDRNMGSTAPG